MAIETMTPDEYRKVLAEAMSEKALQANVRKLAAAHGWRAFCWWSSLHSPAGWPDLVLIRERLDISVSQNELSLIRWSVEEDGPGWRTECIIDADMIFIENKSEKGKLTPEQEEAHRLLRLTGHAVYVWRPSSLLNGELESSPVAERRR